MLYSEEDVKRIYNRLSAYNTKVIKKIAQRIREIGEITPSDAQRLNILAEANIDIAQLEKELRDILRISVEEAEQLYKQTALDDINFAERYYKYRKLKVPQIRDMSNIITGMAITTSSMIENMSIIGFSDKLGNRVVYRTFKDRYIEVINNAIQQSSMGLESYQTTMRETIKSLADSGIRRIDYASGYSQRLDSAVRRNIIDGARSVSQQVQIQIGEEIGADGYEISVHEACAPDHLLIQGKQYSIEKYNELNESLTRPIGHLNCRHFAMPIILGISEPTYTEKQRQRIVEKNNKKYKYEDEEYTKYEATQVQRRLETEIRKLKDEYIGLKEFGDKEGMAETRNKINILRNKYIQFSKAINIEPKLNRASVSGYLTR